MSKHSLFYFKAKASWLIVLLYLFLFCPLDIIGETSNSHQYNLPDITEIPYAIGIEYDDGYEGEGVSQGQQISIDIIYEEGSEEMRGLEFIIGYDSLALAFAGITAGELFDIPGGFEWEYYTCGINDYSGCYGECPTGLIRVFAIADIDDGPHHPKNDPETGRIKVIPPNTILFTLDFLVSDDPLWEGAFVPITFFWKDCTSNGIAFTFSEDNPLDVKLAISRYVYDYDGSPEGNPIHDYQAELPTYFGAPDECMVGGSTTPHRIVDYYNGGIQIESYPGTIWHVSTTGSDETGDGSYLYPFATVQHGIDMSSDSDMVLVTDGIYTGDGNRDISFGGKSIIVKSGNGPENTIIDCEGSFAYQHRGFRFYNNEDSSSILLGFSVINGYYDFGGAILCEEGTSPVISYCVLEYNSTEHSGGAIYCESGVSPKLKNCVFNYNETAYSGGAIYMYGCNSIITSCIFRENIVDSHVYSPRGGGIYMEFSEPELIDCIFYKNTAINSSEEGYGGGMYCISSSPLLSNCTFTGDSAKYGGAVCFDEVLPFAGANLPDEYYEARGKDKHERSPTIFENCLIAYGAMGGAMHWLQAPPEYPVVNCSDIYGNNGGDWTGYIASQADVNGNISLNPRFCDSENFDLFVGSNSPCAPDNNECQILIGALNVGCQVIFTCGDVNDDDAVDILDVLFLIDYKYKEGPAPSVMESGDVNSDDDVNILDIIYLINYKYKEGPEPDCP